MVARGGVVPGYTPGRDTTLAAVSGGEAIMRPEWTRAVGPDYVQAANRAARTGGYAAVKDMVGFRGPTFALGGIYRPSGFAVGRPAPAPAGDDAPGSGGYGGGPLIGTVVLNQARSSTRSDADLIGDEIGWRARTSVAW